MRCIYMTWKKYCVDLLGLSLIVIVAYIIPAEWVRHRLNEVYVGDDIAIDMQLNENALYGSALMEDICFLKYGMISRTEPDIIALGTSRSMQFRAAFFKGATFYTTGGMGDSIDAMEAIFDHICINYVPKIVIFAVDWDWLNPNYPHPKLRYVENNTLTYRAYLYQSLYQEIWRNQNVREQLVQPNIKERDLVGNRPTIGLMAGGKSSGFRQDGSYQYGDGILHPQSTEVNFEDTHQRIRDGNKRFERADHIDEDELLKLTAFIQKMQKRGTHVLVVLPPFPNEIYQTLMASEGHRAFILQFEDAVRSLCVVQDVPFYDFTNMAWLGASDEEAFDGFHASERTYGRITLQFEIDPVIAPYINKDFIEACMVNSNHPFQIIPADM